MNELLISSHPSPQVATYERPALLIEYLPDQPERVLNEVFCTMTRCDMLIESLANWLASTAFMEDEVVQETTQLSLQQEFYNALPLVIQALYTIHGKLRNSAGTKQAWQVIEDFCSQYTKVYTRRELWCLFNAAIIKACDDPMKPNADEVLEWFEQVASILEAAYIITYQAHQS